MNKVMLIGNITRDPELRATPSGVSVCNFDMAVNERRGGQDSVTYFRVTAWRELGEACRRYLSKGKKVFVSGAVSDRAYEAADGKPRASLEVTAHEVEFLTPKSAEQPGAALDGPVAQGYTQVEPNDLPF